MVSRQHTNGIGNTYPQHQSVQCSRQLIRFVEVSNCQKQSVSDAFQYVVLSYYDSSFSYREGLEERWQNYIFFCYLTTIKKMER